MSDRNISGGSDVVPLQTKAVQDAPQSLASSPAAFLDYMCGPVEPTPLIFRAAEQSREPGRTRGQEFLETLRAAGDRMVEIEAGRDVDLDECLHLPHDHRVTVPLNAYLDWLCDGTAEFPQAPWYLAQWYAQDEVPGMRDAVRAPSLLTPLIEDSKADMYRCGFFIGPPTAISPLHSDPYCNLYTLHVSSDASTHAKHWLLLPPSLGKPLAPPSHGYAQPNMSPLDCRLRRRQDEDGGFDVLMDRTSVPGQTALDVLDAGVALSCVMREGDMLFVPRRWWHRVENVVLQGEGARTEGTGNVRQSGRSHGWTVGVGWWFLPRSVQHTPWRPC
ncbi:Clavaminate synthase-like protein, partial [Lentinus brumalis]